MNNKIILAIIFIGVLGIAGFLLLKGNLNTTKVNSGSLNQNSQPTQANKNVPTANINVSASGFEPLTLKVKTGTRVIWINKSGTQATVNSDPHPTHTLWSFLNLGQFDNGSSVSVVFEKRGTYTYHNHFNPSQKGTVVVE